MAEPTGAAFGIYPSSGRRPERLNQSRGVNAPLQLARGWAAGLLGLPGDIEGLVRMLPGIKDETPVLPTSDFYREYLPGYDPRPAARAMSGLGALTGGAGATSVVRGGLGAVKRATDLNAIRDYVRSAQGLSGLPGTAVVKPKGGNWISGAGSPEEAVRGLKTHQNPQQELEYIRAELERPQRGEAYQQLSARLPQAERETALNSWIDQKLAKYIRNEMGTPEDPLRALIQERGVSHLPDEDLMASQAWVPDELAERRVRAGFPEEGMAERLHAERGWPRGGAEDRTRMAAGWEAEADAPLEATLAGDLLRTDVIPGTDLSRRGIADMYLRENPWLAKVPPETPVYSVENVNNLGFGHLVDELRNAVREGSDLPAELRLRPEQLSKVSMPQAVELVDRINKWRAAQKAEADLARAGNAATVEYKTYDVVPGTALPNERGLRWVELRAPEFKPSTPENLPEGFALSSQRLPNGKIVYDVIDPRREAGKLGAYPGVPGFTPEEAVGHFNEWAARNGASPELETALKYEGETMGHCVGGYCPDVIEGRSRIFSLRDAKGQPHVTVEVKPDTTVPRHDHIIEEIKRVVGNNDIPDDDAYDALYKQAMASVMSNRPPEIKQIKGKANKAPKDEYLPYVQDFVRSGQWGRVEDLQNTGLIRIDPESDLAAAFSKINRPNPGYVTQDELTNLMKWYRNEGALPEGFARGGAVRAPAAGPMTYDPDRIAALAEQLTMEA